MTFRFLPQEIADMEQMFQDNDFHAPPKARILVLTEEYNAARMKEGQKEIVWKQIWNWFQNKRHSMRNKGLIVNRGRRLSGYEEPPGPGRPGQAGLDAQAGALAKDVQDTSGLEALQQNLEFEAKSLRDGAWYDVERFNGHRKNPKGEWDVRVQFAGFGEDDSEWVDARSAVRQRSLPCEASECVAVLPNDLILCFQEANEQALYFDADVLDVQRRRHDVRGCRCRFWVRYCHDGNEEVVPLRKICRRPDTEYRLRAAQQAQAALLPQTAGGSSAAPTLPGDQAGASGTVLRLAAAANAGGYAHTSTAALASTPIASSVITSTSTV